MVPERKPTELSVSAQLRILFQMGVFYQALPNKVEWIIDGNLVRVEQENIPDKPMELHLNIWVPESDWSEAYSPDLMPTATESSNQIFSMSIDYVHVETYSETDTSNSLSPAISLLLLSK